VIWLWGHEHRFAVYGKYQVDGGIPGSGRCIGHGGMPIEVGSRKSIPRKKKIKRFGLVLTDNRVREFVDDTPVGHNGYATLTIRGNALTIEHKDESTWLMREEWTVDLNGTIAGKDAVVNSCLGLLQTAPAKFAIGLPEEESKLK